MVDCLFNVPDNSSLNRLELYGSQGSILAEGTIGQGEQGTMIARLESDAVGYAAQQDRSNDGGIVIAPKQPVNMYRAEVEAFSAAILNEQHLQLRVMMDCTARRCLPPAMKAPKAVIESSYK